MTEFGEYQDIYQPEDYDFDLEINTGDIFSYENSIYLEELEKLGASHRENIIFLMRCMRELFYMNDFYAYKIKHDEDSDYFDDKTRRFSESLEHIGKNEKFFPYPDYHVTRNKIYNFFDNFIVSTTNSAKFYPLFFAYKLRILRDDIFLIDDFLKYQFLHRFQDTLKKYARFLHLIKRQYANLLNSNVIETMQEWIELAIHNKILSESVKSINEIPRPLKGKSVIIDSRIILPLAKFLKEKFIPMNSLDQVIEVLEGELPDKKLYFQGEALLLIGIFYQLKNDKKNLLRGMKSDITNWICNSFTYLKGNKKEEASLTLDYVDKMFSPHEHNKRVDKHIDLSEIIDF